MNYVRIARFLLILLYFRFRIQDWNLDSFRWQSLRGHH